jgi:flagellar hook assembly protein FlgD
MTTNVTIRTNGNYVSEGKIEVWVKSQLDRAEEIKVGPGTNVEKSYGIPHGSTVMLSLDERPATPEEIAAA